MTGDTTSRFWVIVLPAALCGIIYYAYSQTGFFARWIQGIVDPLINLAQAFVNVVFGTSF